jgi:hypothetical protein
MPNVGEKSFPDKLMELHAASLDALVRSSTPAPVFEPYPGDHPCEIAGCAANAPFGLAALPRRVWFCRKHLEEFLCLTTPTQPRFSEPCAKAEPSVGDEGNGTGSETPLIPSNNGRWKTDLFD